MAAIGILFMLLTGNALRWFPGSSEAAYITDEEAMEKKKRPHVSAI